MDNGIYTFENTIEQILKRERQVSLKQLLEDAEKELQTKISMEYINLLKISNNIKLESQQCSVQNLLQILHKYIQSRQKQHSFSESNLQKQYQNQIQKLKFELSETKQNLTNVLKSNSEKEAQVLILKQNRLQMKQNFNRKLTQLNQQILRLNNDIEGLTIMHQKQSTRNKQLQSDLETIQKQLCVFPIQQYFESVKMALCSLFELNNPHIQQLNYQEDENLSLIMRWRVQKNQSMDAIYQQLLNNLKLANKTIQALKSTVKSRNYHIKRQTKQFNKFKKIFIKRNNKRLSFLKPNKEMQDNQSSINDPSFDEGQSSLREQIVQTQPGYEKIQILHADAQRYKQLYIDSQQQIYQYQKNYQDTISQEKKKQIQYKQKIKIYNQKIIYYQQINRTSSQKIQDLEEVLALLSDQKRQLLEQEGQINQKIVLVEENLDKVKQYNRELEAELQQQRQQTKEFYEQVEKQLKLQRSEHQNMKNQFHQQIQSLTKENRQLRFQQLDMEQKIDDLRKQIIKSQQKYMISHYSHHSNISTMNNSPKNCKFQETIKMGKDSSKDYIGKIQNLNQIINYMVNFCKGYNFENETKVRRGCWIQGQPRHVIMKVVEKQNIAKKWQNYCRVKNLCQLDRKTNQLIKTYQSIMEYYFE